MAFKKSKSRRCPVCVGHTPTKVAEVDVALSAILTDIKATGELPKAKDARFKSMAEVTGVAPTSLHFHLTFCLIDMEIQDQRFHELKDLTELISTAKQEYLAYPSIDTAGAVNALLTQWRGLAGDIEGQTDPSLTVEFLVETVLGPMNRKILGAMAEELRELRTTLTNLLPQNQRPYVDSQIKAVLSRVSSSLRDSTDDGLKAICGYYKVELEAQQRRHAMESTATSAFNVTQKDTPEEDAVH